MVTPLHVQNELKYGLEINKVYNEDCLVGMKKIKDKSIDMILCDLPYGTTDCKWDSIIPLNDYIEIEIKNKIVSMNKNEYKLYCFENNISIEIFKIKWKEQSRKGLWTHYKRIIKDDGAIILTATQPFASLLIESNLDMFKYDWIWEKDQGSNFLNVKNEPLKKHENILVFSKGTIANKSLRRMNYNPQGLIPCEIKKTNENKRKKDGFIGERDNFKGEYQQKFKNYPSTILKYQRDRGLHPTQKPIELFEYLIRTYSNEDDIVLDNCMGSGTTAIASIKSNRKFIGFENDKTHGYYDTIIKRIKEYQNV